VVRNERAEFFPSAQPDAACFMAVQEQEWDDVDLVIRQFQA